MCNKGSWCQKPEKLKGKSKDCTPEQIKECHGDSKKHPCVPPTHDRVENNGPLHSEDN